MNDPRVWGIGEEERNRAFPCDALKFAPHEILYRGTGIAAAPSLVFRWLCQLRAAPYSYDWLDNFGRPSPAHLTPGLERLQEGQRIMLIFRLASFERGRSLTIRLASRLGSAALGEVAGTYLVVPVAGGARLLVKVLVRYPRGAYGHFLRRVLPHVDSFMFREQLRRLKRYAERDARATVASHESSALGRSNDFIS